MIDLGAFEATIQVVHAWIPLAVAGASMLANYFGQDAAQRGAADANHESGQMAWAQMAFQERMSNSAHQREVSDLKAAGLNPILSANGGASTPPGATAAMQNEQAGAPQMAQAMISNALALQKQGAEVELMEAQKKNVEALESQAKSQTKNLDVDTVVKSKGIPEAEIKNDAYDIIRPGIKKIKEMMTPNASKIRIPRH